MNFEIAKKIFDLINTGNYNSISDENYNYEEGDDDEPIDWFELIDEILNCRKITDMVDYKGYIKVDYKDNNKDCIFIIEYDDDKYQDKIIAIENENKKLKDILHKLLELDDDISIGKFPGEEIRTIKNLKEINLKLNFWIKKVSL